MLVYNNSSLIQTNWWKRREVMSGIELKNVYKDYVEGQHAVTDLSLTIEDGEFVVFVGPSGCGKSTTLRMIAGLEDITAGEVLIDGQVVNNIHPKDRNIAMVFQNYALYPHMTVAENMGFGLKMKKMSAGEIKDRVKQVAQTIGLEDYLDRLPKELSGGQRQRVALGRAICREPKVFLMDEPLSNLDAKLRGQTRAEIIQLTRKLGITTIYVTHDQVEAMTMADRIVIMQDGFIQQVGSPRDLYLRPENIFVASFMGSPAMNFIRVRVTDQGLVSQDQILSCPELILQQLEAVGYMEKEVILGIRPENIKRYKSDQVHAVSDSDADDYLMTAEIELAEMLGSETLLHIHVLDQPMIVKDFTMDTFEADQEASFYFEFDHAHFFDPQSQSRIILAPCELYEPTQEAGDLA